ncbi:hypothetical protein OG548_17265 [Streptomyces sp. NBC_01356]|uniref:hypothetical protein n=1 Tax=Streptomyces sp. NBC_01356 TaxID=2903836 RepID=UPI002E37F81C|nr:hypothetical protein [Streptomyces sp. NBC_01356]
MTRLSSSNPDKTQPPLGHHRIEPVGAGTLVQLIEVNRSDSQLKRTKRGGLLRESDGPEAVVSTGPHQLDALITTLQNTRRSSSP